MPIAVTTFSTGKIFSSSKIPTFQKKKQDLLEGSQKVF